MGKLGQKANHLSRDHIVSENEGMNTYLVLVYKLHLLTTRLNVFHLTGIWADYEKQIIGKHGF